MRAAAIYIILLCLSSCSSMSMKPELVEGAGGIPTTNYSDAQTVEEIRKLRPQAQLPLSIAVMLPSKWDGLSKRERDIVEAWGESLKKIGFADSLKIVPKSLVPECGYKSESECFLTKSRQAGARLGADAILFINDSTTTDSYLNPLSILNLTIVGMWIAPAHHRDAYSIYEVSLFDIDNGYLYAVAEGYGEEKTIRPYMYSDYRTGEAEARIKALNDVGNKLVSLAQEQMKKLSTAHYENR